MGADAAIRDLVANLPPITRDVVKGILELGNKDASVGVHASASPTAAAMAAGTAFTVVLAVTNTNGELNKAVNGSGITLTVETDRGTGTVTLSDTTPEFTEGLATITITPGGTGWAAADTVTIKVSASEIFGYDLVDATGFTVATVT